MECLYLCEAKVTHQCPKCNRWYCAECHDTWLPIDDHNWPETTVMCTLCRYMIYELPKFREDLYARTDSSR